MNRYIALFLLLSVFLGLTACTKQDPAIQEPVSFYYRRSALSYGENDTAILSLVADANGHKHDFPWILGEYLKGPQSEDMLQTFPHGTTLVSLTMDGDAVTVVLSKHLGQLTGVDLTIACACLTKTVIGLTNAKTVIIQAENSDLNGAPQIVMDEEILLLLDNSASSNN